MNRIIMAVAATMMMATGAFADEGTPVKFIISATTNADNAQICNKIMVAGQPRNSCYTATDLKMKSSDGEEIILNCKSGNKHRYADSKVIENFECAGLKNTK